jgi:uncharacterized OsmC-like protein
MELVSSDFKSVVEGLRAKVVNAKDPNQTIVTFRADAKLLGPQYQEVKINDFVIAADEPISSGGTNKAPRPLDFFVASIGFCENAIFAELSIDSLETAVSGSWDRRGLYDIDGVSSFFKSITVETRISTRDPVQKVVEVAIQTHRRCPVNATLSRATEMIFKLVVNGQNVPL